MFSVRVVFLLLTRDNDARDVESAQPVAVLSEWDNDVRRAVAEKSAQPTLVLSEWDNDARHAVDVESNQPVAVLSEWDNEARRQDGLYHVSQMPFPFTIQIHIL